MRVLVTGLSSFWGGRVAQELERKPEVEVIIGVSTEDPTCELHRTEFVRVGNQHALLRRIVQAADIDTVVDTRLVVDSAAAPARVAHEQNVIGTMNILAACGGPDSPVRSIKAVGSVGLFVGLLLTAVAVAIELAESVMAREEISDEVADLDEEVRQLSR